MIRRRTGRRIVRNFQSSVLRTKLDLAQMRNLFWQNDVQHLSKPAATGNGFVRLRTLFSKDRDAIFGNAPRAFDALVYFVDILHGRSRELCLDYRSDIGGCAHDPDRGFPNTLVSGANFVRHGLFFPTTWHENCATSFRICASKTVFGLAEVLRNTFRISYGIPYPQNFKSARSFA